MSYLYNKKPNEITKEEVLKEANRMVSEINRKDLMHFLVTFGYMLDRKEMGDISRNLVKKESEFINKNLDKIKKSNELAYDTFIDQKQDPNLNVLHPYNRKKQIGKHFEEGRVYDILNSLERAKEDIKNTKYVTTVDGNSRIPMNFGQGGQGGIAIITDGKVYHTDNLQKKILEARNENYSNNEKNNQSNTNKSSFAGSNNKFDDGELYLEE